MNRVLQAYQHKVKELMSRVDELSLENKVLKRRLCQQAALQASCKLY